MASEVEKIELKSQQERERTKECLADVCQLLRLLSHEACNTRRQLIEVLRMRIAVIETEIGTDEFFRRILP
jgi:hypothetical protein